MAWRPWQTLLNRMMRAVIARDDAGISSCVAASKPVAQTQSQEKDQAKLDGLEPLSGHDGNGGHERLRKTAKLSQTEEKTGHEE